MEVVEIIAEHIKAANTASDFMHRRCIAATEDEVEMLTVEIDKLMARIEYLGEKRREV